MSIYNGSVVPVSTEEITSAQNRTLHWIAGVAAVLSLCGSSLIIFALLRGEGKKKNRLNLLVWLSVADIIANIVTFISFGITAENSDCKVVGFLVTFADLARVLWTACFSIALFTSIFFSYRTGLKAGDLFPFFFAFSFGVPMVLAVVGVAMDAYGDSGFDYCWVKDSADRMYYFYVPLWTVILFNSVVYGVVWWEYRRAMKLHQGSLGASNTTATSKVHRLKYYPAVLALAWSFGTVNRVAQLAGENYFPLMVLQAAFANSQGVMNALVYGSDPMQSLHPLVMMLCCGAKGRNAERSDSGDIELEEKKKKGTHTQYAYPPPVILQEFSDEDAPEAFEVPGVAGRSGSVQGLHQVDTTTPAYAAQSPTGDGIEQDIFVDVDVM